MGTRPPQNSLTELCEELGARYSRLPLPARHAAEEGRGAAAEGLEAGGGEAEVLGRRCGGRAREVGGEGKRLEKAEQGHT